jgi:hypothetical protein
MKHEWEEEDMLLVGKLEENRALGRPRCRWVDNLRDRIG